jgi:hypothetical protein
MSDTIRRAMDHVFPDGDPLETGRDPFDTMPPTIALALVREAVGRLAWEAMTYECDACGYNALVWLTLGVEGPLALREARAYVASPFMVRCWACAGNVRQSKQIVDPRFNREPLNGSLRHVGRSTELPVPLLVPDDVAYFVLPARVDRADAGAELVVPEAALIHGRRFFYEGAA